MDFQKIVEIEFSNRDSKSNLCVCVRACVCVCDNFSVTWVGAEILRKTSSLRKNDQNQGSHNFLTKEFKNIEH